jgi:hypothetical protein
MDFEHFEGQHDSTKRFNQILDEASARHNLKELVWKIYQDPKLVTKATMALIEILQPSEHPCCGCDDPNIPSGAHFENCPQYKTLIINEELMFRRIQR